MSSTAGWVLAWVIGAGVGFLGGLFGKGGSALATPLLHAAGVGALAAVASPLPATVPSTLVASVAYGRRGYVDRGVVVVSVLVGAPAAVLGALASEWVGGDPLVVATEVILAVLGVRLLVRPGGVDRLVEPVAHRRARLVAVALAAGLTGGLLANSGGFLLAPLYLVVLRLDVKTAFACSLVTSAGLAVPGTVTHALLGHIDWALVAVFATASIPLSWAGARTALRTESVRLERLYGAGLAVLGVALLMLSR